MQSYKWVGCDCLYMTQQTNPDAHRIEDLTDGYEIPDDACTSYRNMLDRLRMLEKDMHQHVHKENNILFPRARDLKARTAGA